MNRKKMNRKKMNSGFKKISKPLSIRFHALRKDYRTLKKDCHALKKNCRTVEKRLSYGRNLSAKRGNSTFHRMKLNQGQQDKKICSRISLE